MITLCKANVISIDIVINVTNTIVVPQDSIVDISDINKVRRLIRKRDAGAESTLKRNHVNSSFTQHSFINNLTTTILEQFDFIENLSKVMHV